MDEESTNPHDYEYYGQAHQYIEDVASGKILACRSVRGACKRHLKDLKRKPGKRFPYRFSMRKANAVIGFFPTFTCHSIGKDAGKPFQLAPWQSAFVALLFGWTHYKTGARRFTKAWLSVARKNGKSTLAAAIALLCAGWDKNPRTNSFESVAQVVIAASKKEQAERVTMAECIRMRQSSDFIKKNSIYKNRQITFPGNMGQIITVGSDRAFDGLNPSLVIVDELHSFRSTGNQAEFFDTMKTGSGARLQPIFLVTTTAGSTTSSLWKQEHRYAYGVATGEYKDDTYLAFSYELDEGDDPLDPENWIKANPCLGLTLTEEYLRDQAKPAMHDNTALNRFTRYHANRVVSNLDAAFNLEHWDECEGELSDWSEAVAVGGGIDIGGRDDLCSFSLTAKFELIGDDGGAVTDDDGNPVYRYETRSWSFIADDTPRDLSVQPFAGFIENGLLRRVKYPISDMQDECDKECQRHGVVDIAIDPYGAQQIAESLNAKGIPTAGMPQTTGHYHEPISEFRRVLADGRFRHDGNALLRWAMGNAVTVMDRSERIMLSKKDSAEKIDPAVSMIMSFARCMFAAGRSGGYFLY